MNKGSKVSLRHAANAIEGKTKGGVVKLGARARGLSPSVIVTQDLQGRPFPSVYLAQRAGITPGDQTNAQAIVVGEYGLSLEQVQKLDTVAASTHNLKQRSQRVASYLRNVVAKPGYLGRGSSLVTGSASI